MLKQIIITALRSKIGREILTILFTKLVEWLRDKLIKEQILDNRITNSFTSITQEARNKILVEEFIKNELPKLLK